jgi:phage-related tail protein
MSKFAITKDMSRSERMAAIKSAAERFNRRKAFRAKMAAAAKNVRRWTDEVEKPARQAKELAFDENLSRMDENHNHYQDAGKYLAEHYGDRVADQRSYESNEGWN